MVQRNSRLIGGIYQVGQMLTSGPLLSTFSAYNRNTSEVVGLLVIELPSMFDPSRAEQLLSPLEQRRKVQSPQVIRVYDWGMHENKVYIATDPPRGVTLRHVLDNENIDLQRAIDLTIQMARGLAALQAQGIVSIDLRPQLITVDTIGINDRAQLDDVNLRALLKQLGYIDSGRNDDIGYLDPRYAAPETISNGPIGPASDVYHLGLILFELVTGRPPFVGRNPAETGVMQTNSPVPRMTQFQHDTPQTLVDLVDRALAKHPSLRFPNAVALLAALENLPIPRRPATGAWRAIATQPTVPPGSLTPSGGMQNPISVGLTSEMNPITGPGEATLIDNDATIRRSLGSGPLINEKEGAYAHLEFEKAGEPTQQFPLKEKYVIIGRVDPKRGLVPEIDLSDIDPTMTVSRQHARIRYEKTFFYIEDLKSRNKTRLGQLVLTPLKPELLQHGDIVHFGSVRMVFRVPGMQDVPMPKPLE